MTNTPIDPRIEMKINGVWTDITADVRLGDADSGGDIEIKRGIPNEGGSAEPTEFDFVLNNRLGKYSPKNPYSPNFGKLGRNTPVRIAISRRSDDFNRTEVDWWGFLPSRVDTELKTIAGDKWNLIGTRSRFDITPGAATISSTTGYTMAQFGTYGDVDILTKVKVSNLTSEFGIVMRGKDARLGIDGFENGIGTWLASGGTSSIASSTAQFHSGTKSLQLTVAGAPATASATPNVVPVINGRSHRLYAWMRPSAALTTILAITWYDASMAQISQATATNADGAGAWVTHSLTATAPDGAAFAAWSVGLTTSPANGSILWIDDVEFLDNTDLEFYTAYITPGTPDLLRLGIGTSEHGVSANWVSQTSNVVADTWYWMRAQMTGSRRRVRFWADGSTEPRTWGHSTVDNVKANAGVPVSLTGQVGLFAKDGSAVVTFASIEVNVWRAHTEVTELPPRWDLSRQDKWTPIASRGVLRRLGQGRKALDSAVTLHLNSYAALSKGWLPLEIVDDTTSTVGNRISGAQPGTSFGLEQGTIDQSGVAAGPGLGGCATLSTDNAYISMGAAPGGVAGPWTALMFFRILGPTATDAMIWQIKGTGTAKTIEVWYTVAATGAVSVKLYDGDGVLITSGGPATLYFDPDVPQGSWVVATLYQYQSGGNVVWAFNWHHPGSITFWSVNGSYAGLVGLFQHSKAVGSAPITAAGPMQVAHMFHYQGDLPFVTSAFARAAYGYIGEDAIVRFLRLTANAGVMANAPSRLTDGAAATPVGKPMGAQTPSKLLDLLDECAQVDDGYVVEERDSFALYMRPRVTLYDQKPVVLNIDSGHLSSPLEPTDDDQRTRNDVTLSRPGGGFYRAVQTTGPLNTNDPEVDPVNGVGTYAEAPEINYATDVALQPAANWRRSKGTLDIYRYPSMTADLTASAYQASLVKTGEVTALDCGDMASIFNTEVDYIPVEQLIQGYTEKIGQYTWQLQLTSNPGALWRVGILSTTTRLATRYITLDDVFTSGTSNRMWTLTTAPGTPWVLLADSPESYPFEIEVDGARLIVEAPGNVLNSNPYFDTGIAGWALHGTGSATLVYWERGVGKYHDGVGSIKCVAQGATTGGAVATVYATTVALADYEISGWVMTDVNIATVSLVVDWYTSGLVFVSTTFPTTIATTAGVWTFFRAVVTAPATGVRALVRVRAALAVTNVIWADSVRLMPVSSYSGVSQLISVTQTPTNGVNKALTVDAPIEVVDPWRLAF